VACVDTYDQDDGVEVELGAESLQLDDPVPEVLAGVESRVMRLLSCPLKHSCTL